jgi:TonB family protein
MEFRGNIIFSIVLHATVCMAALALAGGDAALHVPESYVAVTLFERAIDHDTVPIGNEKKEPAKKTAQPAKGLREIRPPEVPLPVQVRAGRPPLPPQGKIRPIPIKTAEPAKTGVVEGNDTFFPGQGGAHGDPEITPAEMQLAIPGKTATPRGSGDGGKNEAGGDPGAVNAIRAAIDRAKSYPPLARRRGIEGTVIAEFTISKDGHPENIRIVRSSGYEILDTAAKKTLLRASPFPPVRGKLEVPITFKIDR